MEEMEAELINTSETLEMESELENVENPLEEAETKEMGEELINAEKEEDKIKESEDYRTLKNSVQQIRELAEKYEENAREVEEASEYCTTEDLSFAGVGMEDRIIDCSINYREMAQKLNEYADSLEANLNEIK